MITEISVQHVKGLTGTFTLTPATAIVGPNFTGKTALRDAIALGLLGYVPELGKKGSFQIASGNPMLVDLKLDLPTGPARILRNWTQGRNGSVKATSSGTVDWPAQLIDVGLFIGATAKEKMRMVASAARQDDTLKARMREKFGLSDIASIEDLEAAATAADKAVTEAKALVAMYEKTTAGTALIDGDQLSEPYDAAAHARAKEAHASATHRHAQACAKLQAAVDGANAHAARMEKRAALPPLDVLDAQFAATMKQLGDATAARDRAVQEFTEAKQARQDIGRALAEARGLLAACEPRRPGIDPDEEPEVITEMEDAEARSTFDRARSKRLAIESAIGNLQARCRPIREQIEKIESMACCPTCQASHDGWRDAVLATLTAEESRLVDEMFTMNQEREEATALEAAAADMVTRLDERRQHAQRIREARARRDAQNTADTLDQQYAEATAHLEDAEEALENSPTTGDLSLALEHLRNQIADAKALRDLPDWEPVDLRALEDDVRDAAAALARAEDTLALYGTARDQWTREQERQQTIIDARNRHDKAKRKLEDAQQRAADLRDQVAKETAAIWHDITTAGDWLAEKSGGALPCRVRVQDGQIGTIRGDAFVPFEALSGSEQLVATAAIQVGLAASAPARIVILDELSRMTTETKTGFLTALAAGMKAGYVDQVIVIDHDAAFWRNAAPFTAIEIPARA